jgi:hypothetical protein
MVASNKAHESGMWCTSVAGELISIEDILQIADGQAGSQDGPMTISIIADCSGAAGIYHRLVRILNDGSLDLNENIIRVIIFAPCDYDEIAYASTEHGSLYTYEGYKTQKVKVEEEN